MLIGVITILTSLLLAFLGLKRPKSPPGTRAASGRYRGVSIEPVNGFCCASCDTARGRRFVASEVPHLPLTQCRAMECSCRYRHHEDRRAGHARRLSAAAAIRVERRMRRDRRAAHSVPAHAA